MPDGAFIADIYKHFFHDLRSMPWFGESGSASIRQRTYKANEKVPSCGCSSDNGSVITEIPDETTTKAGLSDAMTTISDTSTTISDTTTTLSDTTTTFSDTPPTVKVGIFFLNRFRKYGNEKEEVEHEKKVRRKCLKKRCLLFYLFQTLLIQINSLHIPYSMKMERAITSGSEVTMRGRLSNDAKMLEINLLHGSPEFDEDSKLKCFFFR